MWREMQNGLADSIRAEAESESDGSSLDKAEGTSADEETRLKKLTLSGSK